VSPDPIRYDRERGELYLLDQRFLPFEESFRVCRSFEEVATAIEDMTVRGAPAIGIAAAYGVALAARSGRGVAVSALERLGRTRPTAVNLFWALRRMGDRVRSGAEAAELEAEAVRIHASEVAACRRIGAFGAELLPDPARIMTICNAGGLATGGYGTALGVPRAAVETGKRVSVVACETRPRLQGARLTAYELAADGIPVTVICDGAAAWYLRTRGADAVVVGADRIAANGDTANKIGTYGLSLAAEAAGVPFYVAAPLSTIDPSLVDGSAIPVEERGDEEVRSCAGARVLPEGIPVWNPAFDVTPAERIRGILTEAGVLRPPYGESIREALARRVQAGLAAGPRCG
jgi:methylthioribose-1-phosphate isomerase